MVFMCDKLEVSLAARTVLGGRVLEFLFSKSMPSLALCRLDSGPCMQIPA